MVNFDRAIEQIIQNTIARGEFDNLAGKGKPLNLNENQLVDRDWRMACSLLEQHGYALPWMEERKSIEESMSRAKENLSRTWRWCTGQPVQENIAEREWQQAVSAFGAAASALNKRINAYTLSIPADIFYRPRISTQREIQDLMDS